MLDGYATDERGVRPFYLSMFRAYVRCLDMGKPPTYANLASVLQRSRQSVWELFQRYPGLRPWLDHRCADAQTAMLGSILYRTGMLAMQGSDRHIELYLKHAAGAFARVERGDQGDVPNQFHAQHAQYNFLVPAPPMPTVARAQEIAAKLPPPNQMAISVSALPPRPATVPVVSTR